MSADTIGNRRRHEILPPAEEIDALARAAAREHFHDAPLEPGQTRIASLSVMGAGQPTRLHIVETDNDDHPSTLFIDAVLGVRKLNISTGGEHKPTLWCPTSVGTNPDARQRAEDLLAEINLAYASSLLRR